MHIENYAEKDFTSERNAGMEIEKKEKSRMRRGVLIGAAVLFAGLLLGGGLLLGMQLQKSRAPAAEETLVHEVRGYLDDYYSFERDAKAEEEGMCRGLVDALGDPYSEFYSPDEWAAFLDADKATHVGVGGVLRQEIATGRTAFTGVIPNGPADKAGIQLDDVLLAVDGTDITDMELSLIINTYIAGEPGSSVEFTIYRPAEEREFTVTMARASVVFPSVSYKMTDENTGYIQIIEFTTNLPEDFDNAVKALQAQNMTQLVLDLRENPGGDLYAAAVVADRLLPDTVSGTGDPACVVRVQSANGELDYYFCRDGQSLDLPIAILVNENSASASELLSAALRDNGRAVLVGDQTFGKGIVQSSFALSRGGMKITTAEYFTPSGFALHEVGLTPDIPVTLGDAPLAYADRPPDEQLHTAVRALDEIRSGARTLPAVTAKPPVFTQPDWVSSLTGKDVQRMKSFPLTREDLEKSLFKEALPAFFAQTYRRTDAWPQYDTGYALSVTFTTLPEEDYLFFEFDPVTGQLQLAEMNMPAARAIDCARLLAGALMPDATDTELQQLWDGLKEAPAGEEDELFEVMKLKGCRVFAAESDGLLTIQFAR